MKKPFLEWLTAVGIKKYKCHICKSNTSEECYCEECSSTYNQFSQIDYNCCEYCQEAVENKYRYERQRKDIP